jgi:RimJ/RimL family protein N-acetyltransferase
MVDAGTVLETERLVLRRFGTDDADAAFIVELVNEPAWLRFIGDKGVRTIDDARNYIANGPLAMYQRYGFGLYLAVLKETGESIGMCGLIKRDALADVDLGFAFLPAFRGRGYAFEAATAVKEYGIRVFGLQRLLAVTSQENEVSSKLLEKLGFRFERLARLTPDGPELKVYSN